MLSDIMFLLSAGFLLAAVHPFVSYPASLKLLAIFHKRPLVLSASSTLSNSRIALCLCAYNEQHVIKAKVENMLSMRHNVPNLDILVYVDAASDRTMEILSEFGSSIKVMYSTIRHGKTHGMNLLVKFASADIIVFTDANVIFAEDALTKLLQPFGDPSVGCVLGHLRYVSEVRSATAKVGQVYWSLEEKIKELESQTGSVITSDGAIFAIRRSLHQPPPPEVSDDIYISLSILCSGHRVVRVADAVAYEEAVASAAEEFKRKVRIACLAFTVHCILWPKLRALGWLNLYKYVSHKLLRWLTIYLLGIWAALLVVALEASFGWLVTGLAVSVGVVMGVMVWLSKNGPLATVGSALQAFAATGVGVWNSLRGMSFQTWTPPASTREQITNVQTVAALHYEGAIQPGTD